MDLTPHVTPHVVVTVDELDLGAVPAARRHVMLTAFERELTRLVTERLPRGSTRGNGDRSVTLTGARPDGNPVLFGTALARTVYAALERESA
ncbi:hypothetical protein [Pseudonocardia sp.]|uniref:hypothetical protein n=1 Tax=Pseudonocardia sp. TaxID=60912 RepID=UPI003D113558